MFIQSDNLITAKGRLARDPEAIISPKNGMTVTRITVAQETPFKDKETGKNKIAYVDYTAFSTEKSKSADNLANYAVQGSPITLTAFNDFNEYEKEGKKEYRQFHHILSFRIDESKEQTIKRAENNKQKGTNK